MLLLSKDQREGMNISSPGREVGIGQVRWDVTMLVKNYYFCFFLCFFVNNVKSFTEFNVDMPTIVFNINVLS
jgi:hypothetical protein